MSKFFTQFNPQKVEDTSFEGVASLTQTQFADQCDINFMIARLQRGDTSVLRTTGVAYRDISEIPEDLHSVMEQYVNARSVWESNPVYQKRFGTIENLFDFLADDNNRDEAIKLGFIDAPKKSEPVKVEVTNPVTPTDSQPKA